MLAAAFAAQAHSLFRRFLNKVRQAGKSFARPNPITHIMKSWSRKLLEKNNHKHAVYLYELM